MKDRYEQLRTLVLKRHQEILAAQEQEDELDANIDALDELTAVPKTEIQAFADQLFSESSTAQEPVLAFLQTEAYFPPELRDGLSRLSPLQQEEFLSRYSLLAKRTGLSYLFALLPPPFSAHYLYLGRWWMQIPFFFTCGGFYLWWLVDLFQIKKQTYLANRQIARRLYKQVKRGWKC